LEIRKHFDVAVAGGGPAGCSAAITAAQAGLRVLLLDAGAFPRHKVCGEFVSSEALHLLSRLLAGHRPELITGAVELTSAVTFLDGESCVTRLSPPARSMTRYAMDAALWSAAGNAGATVLQRTPVTGFESNGNVTIATPAGSFTADSFINASGRWSLLRKQAAAGPSWIGLKAHYFAPETQPAVQLYFFHGGYCGVQPVGNGQINVCAMVRADIARHLQQVFALEPRLCARSRTWKLAMPQVSTAPLVFRPPDPVSGGALHVGDAAAFIDPFVGDGISLALHSGRLAAESVLAGFAAGGPVQAAERYREEYSRRLAPVVRNSALLRKLLAAPMFARRVAVRAMRFPAISEWIVRATRPPATG
jgi:menaquinone-9 beta-reductase